MTRRIVFLMICAAALSVHHGRALAKEGGPAALKPLPPTPAAEIGPLTVLSYDLRLWKGDQTVADFGSAVVDGAGIGFLWCGIPGGLVSTFAVVVPQGIEPTKQDLEAYLDRTSGEMFLSAATKFCFGGVCFYVYAPGVDHCDVRITKRESWVARRGVCLLVDEHSLGWLSTRVFEPGVTLHSK